MTHPDYLPYLASGSFAAIAGALSYLLKVEEGRPFRWSEFVLHTAISALAGLITYVAMSYATLPPDVCGALSGVAGWMGTRLLRILEIVVRRRFGVSDEDVK